MRVLSCFIICVLMSSCVGSKLLVLKNGSLYSIKPEEQVLPVVSFSVPEGYWSISKVTLKTKDRGWFDIDGRPSGSPAGYSIKFSIKSFKKNTLVFEETAELLKDQVFQEHLHEYLDVFTPQLQQEMKAENVGGKLTFFNGLKCINTWYQQKIAPLAFDGKGLMQFNSNVTCPLIIDGAVYLFEIGISSAIDPKFYEWQAEYNKNKRPEDPEVTIDTYQHLTTLSDKVFKMFSDIRFHGRFSQNYEDIIDK